MARKKSTPIVQEIVPKEIVYKVNFSPKTPRQRTALAEWKKGKFLFLDGYPGTGKTYLALAFALEQVLRKDTPYEKVVIIRSLVPSRDIGFLKGGAKEKGEKYETPYINLVGEILGDKSAYGKLVSKGQIEFESTSFQRGVSIDNAIMICDEIQNYEWNEFNTIFTRVGKDTRLIACGDGRQDDVSSARYHRESAFDKARIIAKHMEEHFSHVEFQIEDIVRSGFVRDYIMAVEEIMGG